MSVGPTLNHGGDARGSLLSGALHDARLEHAITDLFVPDEARLDERTRQKLAAELGSLVRTVEADIRQRGARLLSARGAMAKAELLLNSDAGALGRLSASGLLRDRELIDELLGRIDAALVAEALPVSVDTPDRPSLLVRLASLPDSVVAAAATALLAAENRRSDAVEHHGGAGDGLPAELHHRLAWWVAATIREGVPADSDLDRAISEGAQRSLAAHDESDRVEVVAVRLAAAIDPLPQEVPALLVEAIGDRRLSLFLAILARALDTDFDVARAMVIEPVGEQLWLALRAAGLERGGIARIGLALADADPRRDVERFADRLDDIAAVGRDDARAALSTLSLPRSFRAAIRALARSAAS